MVKESYNPRVTLEQWRCFLAVVDQGGFAQAAEYLNKSQSTVSYSVNKMQDTLGLALLEIEGRKSYLTTPGKEMYRYAHNLLKAAVDIESMASFLKSEWEPELRLIVDNAFPTDVLLDALKVFQAEGKGTRIVLEEAILSGAEEALEEGRVDLAISFRVPQGFKGEFLYPLHMIAVASPCHPLFELERDLSAEDLLQHTHVVIKDSGRYKNATSGWLESDQRWRVSSIDKAIDTVLKGLGFSWLPSHDIQTHLAAGRLKKLPLSYGGEQQGKALYLVYGQPNKTGPAAQLLGKIIMNEAEKKTE